MSEYEHVTVEALPDAPNRTDHKWEVDEAVGATEFGFNVYVARPGQQLPWGYHYHPDHEEIFYVIEGTIRIETPEESFDVGAGEAFFVPPGAPQNASAIGDRPAKVIAAGAPKAHDTSIIQERCPNCETETDREYEISEEGDVITYQLFCAECGAETDVLRPGPE